jgi:membrane protein implicated in regulation of membrane protease activity
MFLGIAVIVLILWALGFFIFPVAGGLIHILLVIAVIAIIWHFIKGRNTPTTRV